MGLLSKLLGLSADKSDAPQAIHPQFGAEIDEARRLVEVINESLRLSNDSKIPDTKISRIEIAKARLLALRALASRHPFIKLTSLEAVERDIARMEAEYARAGYYASVDQVDWDHRQDVARGVSYMANADILSGMRFCATLQLRTPLRVLARHGEFHDGANPPVITREMWEGIWVPEVNLLDTLGFQLPPPTMASDIGPVPSNGGQYLPFLKSVRSVVESEGSATSRRAQLIDLLKMPASAEFTEKLGGYESVADRFFPLFVDTIKGLPSSVTTELVRRGLTKPKQLAMADDKVLLEVHGIGIAKLRAIRDACGQAFNESEQYADRVTR